MSRFTVEQRYAGCQSFLQEGCLFLSLCSIAEEHTGRPVDILDALATAKDQRWITPNNELTVTGQTSLLQYLTRLKWTRIVLTLLHEPLKDYEYGVEKWYNKRTGYTHFCRHDYDTLTNSNTVANGKRVELYVYGCGCGD